MGMAEKPEASRTIRAESQTSTRLEPESNIQSHAAIAAESRENTIRKIASPNQREICIPAKECRKLETIRKITTRATNGLIVAIITAAKCRGTSREVKDNRIRTIRATLQLNLTIGQNKQM